MKNSTINVTAAHVLAIADATGRSTDEVLGRNKEQGTNTNVQGWEYDLVTARYALDTTVESLVGVHIILSQFAAAGYEESPALALLAETVDNAVVTLDKVSRAIK